MKIEKFDKILIFRFVTFMHSKGIAFEYNDKKHLLDFILDKESIIKLRLPLDMDFDFDKKLPIHTDFKNYVLIMIRSGIASVGFFENYVNHQHKVFRAYMTRKKQGKSQIKHLKTKGKSRAGSRIRLQETLEFFESINHRIQEHFDEFRIDKIGISCSETLIPYFYGGKVPTPFDKQDERIFKIPKHIQNPTFEELTEVNKFLMQSEIRIAEGGQLHYEAFMYEVRNSEITLNEEKDEDW
ncbi:hypothetical protein [Belliella aquatica]|uniref:VLRF1 domain-containing protein n=1 Tax=Belliella aquatica TaxID=1323734 RepID=A0ABQ1MVK1_9BACT|nr:hypothetical protein [Belliella aquatica]MCH7406657.1 hypothetical protein [Belliella aquatica]GGC47661.1 hypothetical protein GCM10010993_27770 [Belliella aquatica]